MKIRIQLTFLPLVVATLLAYLAGPALAETRSFLLDDKGSSRATFESDAPVENIVGITTSLSGTLTLDLAAPTKSAAANVVVDLRHVKTGIDKRDAHMRSKDFLDTAKFPTAFSQRGLIAESGLTWLLPRRVGIHNTINLIYSG